MLLAAAASGYHGRIFAAGWSLPPMPPAWDDPSAEPTRELPLVATAELLRRARGGDAAAVEDLLARYVPRLRRWARGRLPRYARELVDTDDLIQETFLRATGRLETFEPRGEGAFAAYLRQALHHRIADEIRRVRRRPARADGATSADDRPDPAASPLEEAIGREALESYERALQRLEAPEREAIVLRVELGLPWAEVAAATGRSSADVARVAVGRALVRLAREMDRAGA